MKAREEEKKRTNNPNNNRNKRNAPAELLHGRMYIHSKESACIIISVRSGVLLNSDQGIRAYVGNASLFYSRLSLSPSLACISSGRCVRPLSCRSRQQTSTIKRKKIDLKEKRKRGLRRTCNGLPKLHGRYWPADV